MRVWPKDPYFMLAGELELNHMFPHLKLSPLKWLADLNLASTFLSPSALTQA